MHLPSGFDLIALAETASTNEDAKALAAEGKPHGTIVWARRQSAGKGRQGNEWVSPEGNLYMSVILRPEVALSDAGQLSFVAGVAVAEVLDGYLDKNTFVSLKWPNDILLDGKKLGGILIESEIIGDELSWVVLGIGINVVSAPDYAISLQQAGVKDTTVENVLEDLCGSLTQWLYVWQSDGFAPIRKEWLRRVHGMGEPMSARLPTETLEGTFTGLDETGALLLDIGGGDVVKITAGEVFFG